METVEVKIRMPKEIHAAVKTKAAREGRTLTKQIIQIIKEDRAVNHTVLSNK